MISVQTQTFDVAKEYAALTHEDTEAGAAVFFVGKVRARNEGRSVTGMTLEHYPGMTESALEQIVNDALQRWPLTGVRVIHRVGPLALGEDIVFVGVSSQHREASFSAAEYIMDYLKTQAPFWKQEHTEDGNFWVDAHDKDQRAIERWSSH